MADSSDRAADCVFPPDAAGISGGIAAAPEPSIINESAERATLSASIRTSLDVSVC
jgi:hypothetical protein